MLHLSNMSFLRWNHPSGLGSKDSSKKGFWRRCAGTETPGLLHPVNSIILETETLVPEFCSAIFGFEAGALRRGRARGREPELVCEPELV